MNAPRIFRGCTISQSQKVWEQIKRLVVIVNQQVKFLLHKNVLQNNLYNLSRKPLQNKRITAWRESWRSDCMCYIVKWCLDKLSLKYIACNKLIFKPCLKTVFNIMCVFQLSFFVRQILHRDVIMCLNTGDTWSCVSFETCLKTGFNKTFSKCLAWRSKMLHKSASFEFG